MDQVRCVVFYSGRVQGVGFRYAVKAIVAGYEVVGTIRNLPDGRVELIVEGTRDEVKEFLQAIRDGGLGRHIRDENLVWADARGEFRGFAITG